MVFGTDISDWRAINGYTVMRLKGDYNSRMEYYATLENVQVNNNPELFYHLILDKVTKSLN